MNKIDEITFINFNGIEQYARVMYNDVKDSDKYRIEVAYNGKDIKALLEYLFKLEEENNKQKEVLDKIKEYCNHKLEMLELQKRNIMQILTPENGYLKTDIEIEMQKYNHILELLEEIE